MLQKHIGKNYSIVYADPPWQYKPLTGVTQLADGSYRQGQAGGAEKHYNLLSDQDVKALPVRDIMADKAALFLWATCPRLDVAIETIKSWGLYYRGVAYIWVKTKKDGTPYGAKGPPPAFVKPITELVLVATTVPSGRVFPLMQYNQHQVVMEQRREHSRKPDTIRDNIVRLCGDLPRIELFARTKHTGWDHWGNELKKR